MPCLAIQAKHSRVHCIPEKTKLHPTEMVVFPLFWTRTGHWMLTGLCAPQFFVLLMQKCHFSGWKTSPAASRQLRMCVSSLSWKSREKADRDAECRINCASTCTAWFCSQKKKRFHSALTSQALSEYNFLSVSLGLCTLCVLNLCLLSQCATKPTTDDREQDRPANQGEKKVQSGLSFPFLQLQCFWFPQEDDDRGEFTYVYPSFLIVQPLNIWQKQ